MRMTAPGTCPWRPAPAWGCARAWWATPSCHWSCPTCRWGTPHRGGANGRVALGWLLMAEAWGIRYCLP